MAEKHSRFRVNPGGSIQEDDEWVFEVYPGRIVTFSVTMSGFWKQTPEYRETGSIPITQDTFVEVSQLGDFSDPGSAIVFLKGKFGQIIKDYHIYGSAEEFAAEIQYEIDRAGNGN